ncbi:sugar ABC transporter substrate-binding protein [Solibacillus sp. MA9]|uniref:Sugar ABC transporter substrate-binding protein n=1 Tax=Solibacillus palustris TaxID=2908203 RepID=A0ABS9UFH8_9BACL|nr:sugar ABC transporter substrate-binding protein [Solibacillus sp. MA9]MCH7323087.1 sugar ABC transporter substrate-binding protein [Solibacillus sp. MA9]
MKNSIFKKFGLLFLVLVLSVVMAACNDDKEDTSNGSDNSSSGTTDNGSANTNNGDASKLSGEITVWAHPYTDGTTGEGDMWKDLVANFEADTGVKVNFEQIPWANRDQKILTALAAGQGPDVFYVIPDQMPQYAEQQLILDISQYVSQEELSGFVPTAIEATSWKGKQYGMPILQTAESLIYNKDILKELGVDENSLPTNWDEFKALAEKAKAAGYYAFSYAGGGSLNNTIYPFLWQAGGNVIDADNNILINSPESVKAFELINEMYTKGWIPQDSITALEHDSLYYGGKLLAVNGSGISVNYLLAEKPFEFVIAPPLKDAEQLTYGTVGMFVGSAISKNPEAAAEFMKYITNAENQRTFNNITQYIPTRDEAKDIFEAQPFMAQLSEYTKYAKPGVIHPEGRNIMPLVQAEIQAMLEGKQTPQEAADKSADAIDKLINK